MGNWGKLLEGMKKSNRGVVSYPLSLQQETALAFRNFLATADIFSLEKLSPVGGCADLCMLCTLTLHVFPGGTFRQVHGCQPLQRSSAPPALLPCCPHSRIQDLLCWLATHREPLTFSFCDRPGSVVALLRSFPVLEWDTSTKVEMPAPGVTLRSS